MYIRRLIFAGFILSCQGFLIPRMSLQEFNNFKEIYNKNYLNPKKEFESYLNFKDNYNLIKSKNNKKSSYKLSVNQFSDQSMDFIFRKILSHDFSKMNLKQNIPMLTLGHQEKKNTQKLDWYEAGLVRPVKNQGACGSCWAFSTTGALETMVHANTGIPVELSEQELVSCSKKNFGCEGGWMHTAMEYVQQQNGLYTSVDYPYNATKGTCNLDIPKEKRIIESGNFEYVWIKPKSVSSMKKGLFINPVCIAVKADFDFVFYKDGIFDTEVEEEPAVNHAVLLTALDENKKTWTIKNSWGTSWGKNGFMDLTIQNGTGTAGMNSYGIIPLYQPKK